MTNNKYGNCDDNISDDNEKILEGIHLNSN